MKAILRRSEPAPREQLLELDDVVVRPRRARGDGRRATVELPAEGVRPARLPVLEPRASSRATGCSTECGATTMPAAHGRSTSTSGSLRRKLGKPDLIRTVRGAGYKAVAP